MAEVERWDPFPDSTAPAPAYEERPEDVAVLLEARRRTALYHLERYLSRLEEAPAASW